MWVIWDSETVSQVFALVLRSADFPRNQREKPYGGCRNISSRLEVILPRSHCSSFIFVLSVDSHGTSLTIIKKCRWGQSAGGISIGSQIVANQGDNEGLFHGAIMQSGSPQTTIDISGGQRHYDRLVHNMGCSGSDDTLDCLRDVPYDKMKQAVEDLSPGMFGYEVGDRVSRFRS